MQEFSRSRRYARAALRCEVIVRESDSESVCRADDISLGGLFVAAFRLFPIGTIVELEFTLPDGIDRPLKLQAEVRWIREYNPSAPGAVGMGFQFGELDNTDHDRIEAYVARTTAIVDG